MEPVDLLCMMSWYRPLGEVMEPVAISSGPTQAEGGRGVGFGGEGEKGGSASNEPSPVYTRRCDDYKMERVKIWIVYYMYGLGGTV